MLPIGNFFGANDRTAQTTGVPLTHHNSHDDPNGEVEQPGLTLSRTRSHPASPRHRTHRASLDQGASASREKDTGFSEKSNDEKPMTSDSSPQKTVTPAETNTVAGDGDEASSSSDSEEQRRESLVHNLARHFTTQSHFSGLTGENPFFASEDSPLNPASDNFSARAWARAAMNLMRDSNAEQRTSAVCFQNLNVYGFGVATDFQKSVGNVWLEGVGAVKSMFGMGSEQRIDILRNFDGLVRNGEMLVVLGPPGSGCSTFLKTVAGETNGIYVGEGSYFNYQGMTAKEMHTNHRGEAIYTAETDVHFPQLCVGDTLTFASLARAPARLPSDMPRMQFANHMRDVIMAMFGISHTINTRVGNEYVRGVSGGERKRVTISEAALSGAPLQCWDNSTRGLDSANAIEFCRTIRLQSEMFNDTACVSIYQAPQSAYDMFDKALVLYEGRQIFFGRSDEAKQYFIDLGFDCPARQTTPDFLTSMTSPKERVIRSGWEGRTPRTPDEFATAWKNSQAYKDLQAEIEEYKTAHPLNGPDAEKFREAKQAKQAKGQRLKSPYTLSYGQQIGLCVWRGWKRLKGDPTLSVSVLFGNACMALIIGSVFYNLEDSTDAFYQRGALLFFACLMNAFSSALEILTLYAQRPIVEKHDRYAMYHPSAEAISSMLCDLPYKVSNTILFNCILYFMTNLRRDAGAFFFFLFLSFITVLTMSMMFRTIASSSRTLSQAMVPAAIIILDLVIFTGFVIPIDYMLGWCRWLNYLDPLAYAFESLMVNEFSGRTFSCSAVVPSYDDVGPDNQVCSAVGSVPGSSVVSGDSYLNGGFRYYKSHKWRNVGIIIAFMFALLMSYMITAELVAEKKSKGEVLVFRRGHKPAQFSDKKSDDVEAAQVGPITSRPANGDEKNANVQTHNSTFHWNNLCYDIKIKGEPRRILDNVDGWVKPGTLTALMGVSGAGKTTLLDCLADRTSMGVISGEVLVDGHLRDTSFQRKTGYVQQQDLHLQTTTVREALNFSALLRQPAHVPDAEKLAYVDEVIKLLEMEEYADAVVGVPGEGLNVEQRKRLTIGVELAAKPPLLLFVDEPTSGLDSQTSWAILDLLEKLTKSGQAILCTIHQPSAMLFQRFDRLLFLAKGGKTVYFGDIGKNSTKMTSYFERNGGFPCPKEANPAEWMLEVIGAAPGSHSDIDWRNAWRESAEYEDIQAELRSLKEQTGVAPPPTEDKSSYREFAASFWTQLQVVTHRVFQQYWRTPSYIYSKTALCTLVALFIGFVFYKAPNSIQGLQNQMFAVFNILTVFGQLVQQTMPHFVIQRSLYEVRERPSKVYGWKVFMLSQIVVELPWNTLMAVIMYFCWYYPVGLYNNAVAADQVTERGALVFLYLLCFMLFTSTFCDMVIAGFETAEGGGNIANLLFMLCLIFCGVLASPDDMPGFWIFMYRISPFTYLVSGLLSSAVANTDVTCSDVEYLLFDPVNGKTCYEYMEPYMEKAGGYLLDNNATENCQFCSVRDTNTFLASINSDYADRWRNFGILWAYIIFNIFGALAVYWLVRVPKKSLFGKKKQE
ncbi:ZEB2-regulated ABC transporter 1 [Zalerion maritima]|uniref:ZEB2-regulated ABC transporter 1 n=1 Tax=Zalerion maritima TaxID=339359 RepID=A0AAD5RU64_9PEZI|nr:ZEB2-regulated ABC transporter 1 [Zalerion maritima]